MTIYFFVNKITILGIKGHLGIQSDFSDRTYNTLFNVQLVITICLCCCPLMYKLPVISKMGNRPKFCILSYSKRNSVVTKKVPY